MINSNIMVRRFIQNYFEVHGNFSKIEVSVLSKQIREIAESNNMNLIEFCLTQLGYDAGITQEDMDCMAHWQILDLTWFIDNLNLDNWDAVNDYLKDIIGNRKRVYRDAPERKKSVKTAIDMLTLYYNNNTELRANLVGVLYSTKTYAVHLISQDKKIKTETLINKLNEANLLVDFKTSDKEYITNGTFYHTSFTEKQCDSIQTNAIMNLINGVNIIRGTIKNYGELPFLAINKPATYLSLLEMCTGLGITYAEYMKNYGINIIDQGPIIEQYGCIVNKVGDNYYVTDIKCNNKSPVYETDREGVLIETEQRLKEMKAL